MTAPTAKTILRDLDRRRAQVQIATLGDLDDAASEEVRRALSAVPGNARIDVPLLVELVRRGIAARAEAKAERMRQDAPLRALQYRLSLMSEGRLAELHAHIKDAEARGEATVDFGPGSAAAAIMSRLDAIAERLGSNTDAPAETTAGKPAIDDTTTDLDAALDRLDGLDDDPAPRKRGGVRRVRSRRSQAVAEQPVEPARPAWLLDDSKKPPEPYGDGRGFGARAFVGSPPADDYGFTGPL